MRSSPIVVAAFVLAASCSSSDSSSDDAVTDATLQAFGDTLCAKTQQCAGEFTIRTPYGSLEVCKARQMTQRRLEKAAPGFTVKEGPAKQCVTAIQNLACDQLVLGATPAECKFKGTLALGAKCIADTQCETGSCFVAEGSGCGACTAVALENGDCAAAACDGGLRCNASKKCQRPAASGAACTPDVGCVYGSACVNSVCTKVVDSGAPCSQTTALCDVSKGLTCTPSTLPDTSGAGTCKPFTYAQAGQACPVASQSPVTLAVCEKGACVDGHCKAHVADGAPCGANDSCEAPAECRNGVCSLLDATICR